MYLAKLRSNIGIPLRLFPVPKMGNGFVPGQRNQWMIVSEEDKGFKVLNLVMKHEFLLTRDNIRDYREPQTIILRTQVILTEDGGVEFIPFADAPSPELIRLPGGTFEGPLTIGLSSPDYSKELELPVISLEGLPSSLEADKIQSFLEKKMQLRSVGFDDRIVPPVFYVLSLDSSRPYEERSIEQLREDLANVNETYRVHDVFELCESRAHKINVHLLNEGSEYIDDASMQLTIEKCPGFLLSEKILMKPRDIGSLMPIPSLPRVMDEGYPQVKESAEGYSVFEEIGNIRHGLARCAFEEPLRVVLSEQAKGRTIRIQCSILGRNLTSPRTAELSIKVI